MNEEKKKSLKSLKTDLTGIVMSNPNMMNMNNLLRDFRETIGSGIPVHKYGYSNILSFLREECADIFNFSGDPHNPILTPIVSAEVKHVNDLIYKQRSSTNRRQPRRGPGIIKTSNMLNASSSMTNSSSTRIKPLLSYNYGQNNRGFTSKQNENYRKDSWNVSKQNKANDARQNIANDTRQNITNDTRQNIASPMKYFNSDTRQNIANDTRQNIANDTRQNIANDTRQNIANDTRQNIANDTRQKIASPMKYFNSDNTNTKNNNQVISKPSFYNNNRDNHSQTVTKNQKQDSSIDTSNNDLAYPKNHRLTTKFIQNMKELMEANPEGLWSRELFGAYNMKYQQELELSSLGYNAIISLCKDLPMIFKITRPGKLDWRLFPLSAQIPPEYRDGAENKKQVVENNDSNTSNSIDDIVQCCLSLPGVKCDASLYPEDCAVYGEALHPTLPLPDMFLMQISQVRDPLHFWFQVISKSASGAIDTVMTEMTDFYTNDPSAKNYKMLRAAAKEGQLCAAPYEGKFHRAEIIKNVSWDVVKVYYLDYGTVDDVEFSQVYMLLNQFCDVAVQAHRGRLSGIVPKGNAWSEEAIKRFMDMIVEKGLQGHIMSHSEEENWVSLKLINLYEEINIADVLISEGYALPNNNGVKDVTNYFVSFDDLERGIDNTQTCDIDEDESVSDKDDESCKSEDESELLITKAEKLSNISSTDMSQLDVASIDEFIPNIENDAKCENIENLLNAKMLGDTQFDVIHDNLQQQRQTLIEDQSSKMFMNPFNQQQYPLPLQVQGPYFYMVGPEVNPYNNYYCHPQLGDNSMHQQRINRFTATAPSVQFQGPVYPMPVFQAPPRPDCSLIRLKRSNNNLNLINSKLHEIKIDDTKVLIDMDIERKSNSRSLNSLESSTQNISSTGGDDGIENISSDECQDEGAKPITYINVDEYEIILIDVIEILGINVEIWSVKFKSFIILQQCADAFFEFEDLNEFCTTFDSSHGNTEAFCTLLQDENNVAANLLRKIKMTGKSGVRKGNAVKLINNKVINNTLPFIVLVPIDRLSEVIYSHPKNKKLNDLEIMRSTYALYYKYVSTNNETSNSDSTDDEDNHIDLLNDTPITSIW